ncbi:MAG: MFS transporter, partial [Burkholderiales bacterium]|nr:MFS transporter [Burkholderiales bacterium]
MQNNLSLRSALAASVGGALEWYDFIIYGFFTEVLGQQFFPDNNEYSRHLLIFGIFAVGYWARAVGGLIFGHIGDKYGRSRSLFITMFLGGVATICMAVMPNYEHFGVIASLLFVIARLVQGVTIGANISGAIVYISELTSRKSRSFWISTLFLGTQRGVMLAGVVSAVLFTYLTWGQLHSWGWRVAFLVGVLVMLLAWYSKWHLIETPYHLELQRDHQVAASPVYLFFSQYKLITIIGMGLNTIFSISITFMLFYMPTFMRDYGFLPKEVMHATFYHIFMFSLILPIFGIISDHIG